MGLAQHRHAMGKSALAEVIEQMKSDEAYTREEIIWDLENILEALKAKDEPANEAER